MSVLGWVETTPSDGSAVGTDTPTIRSHWTAMATWIAGTRYWPGTGGGSNASAGELKPGTSLAFFGAQSVSSNTVGWYHTGRAFLNSATTRLYAYESNGTYLAGTPFAVHSLTASGVTGAAWMVRSGTTFISSSGTPTSVTIPFPTPYGAAPVVMTTLSALSFVGGGASSVTTGGFTSLFSYVGPTLQSSFTLYWTSFGTDSSGSV